MHCKEMTAKPTKHERANTVATPNKERLLFIDLARAIAILLMLEGHFVGMTLAEEYRDPGNPLYMAWGTVRRFSAPLFFTVAGMIFAYLLSGEAGVDFCRRKRVRRGLIRVGELLLWGYALQLTSKNIGHYFKLEFENWIFAFHVLQCMACGLLGLIGVAALQGRIGRLPLTWWYGAATVGSLCAFVWVSGLPIGAHVPAGWPEIFQNAIRGPRSVFPLFPWVAFSFLGGTLGVAVRQYRDSLETPASCLWFIALALVLKAISMTMIHAPGLDVTSGEKLAWFAGRAAEVLAFLGVLRWIDIRFGIGVPRLLNMGRLTFEIYVIHVIALYGGIFGMGLNRLLEDRLNPWQAAGGAAAFLLFFFGLAQLIHAWKSGRREKERGTQ